MKLLRLIPDNTSVDFLGKRMATFIIAGMLVIVSALGLFNRGLNLGIDFLGWNIDRGTNPW